MADVEMAEPPHALQLQFEAAEDAAAALTTGASPAAAVAQFQRILGYGGPHNRGLKAGGASGSLFVSRGRGRGRGGRAARQGARHLQAGAALHPVRVRRLTVATGSDQAADVRWWRRQEKELASLLQSLRPFFATVAKAKTGKIGACAAVGGTGRETGADAVVQCARSSTWSPRCMSWTRTRRCSCRRTCAWTRSIGATWRSTRSCASALSRASQPCTRGQEPRRW